MFVARLSRLDCLYLCTREIRALSFVPGRLLWDVAIHSRITALCFPSAFVPSPAHPSAAAVLIILARLDTLPQIFHAPPLLVLPRCISNAHQSFL